MSKEKAAEIRDPVHGYIYLNDVERKVIDTPTFQRLRRIRQLAGAHLTYPGAQHTRFEHSVGTLYLADRACRVLQNKGYLSNEDCDEIRVAALLHDCGHGAFSHLMEEVMTEKRGITHEDVTRRVLVETEIKDILEEHGFSPKRVAELCLGLSREHKGFVNSLLGGGLSVDLMDYLLRDSYFTGVEYGMVDVHRIINSFDVYDDNLAIDYAALYAFEALMIARYEMFRAVYFHRTVRAAEIIIIKAIDLADDYLGITDSKDLARYLDRTDEILLYELTSIPDDSPEELKKAKELAINYRDRILPKCVFEKALLRREKFIERIFSQKVVREQIAKQIADIAKVSEDEVYIDVPTTPSIPISSTREAILSLKVIQRIGSEIRHQTISVNELPLVSSISGFFDMIRVYTSARYRERVREATEDFFGKEGYATKVSM